MVSQVAAKVRKQFLLDPQVLRQARQALGAQTDTEMVERALRSVALDAELTAVQTEFIMSGGELVDVNGRLTERVASSSIRLSASRPRARGGRTYRTPTA